ncbi:MAG: hypothetical protein ACKVOW_12830 [Chitinophagaceae bacterium]
MNAGLFTIAKMGELYRVHKNRETLLSYEDIIRVWMSTNLSIDIDSNRLCNN